MILIRPEESEAAYITKKSKTVKIIKKIIEKFPDEQKIVLSRYKEQTIKLKKIFGVSICLLSKPVSGKELLNNVDCFIGSGGTMTAESGLLGIPTLSAEKSLDKYGMMWNIDKKTRKNELKNYYLLLV